MSPGVIILSSEPSVEVTTQVEQLRHLVRMKKRADFEWKEQDQASDKPGDLSDLVDPSKDDKTEGNSNSWSWGNPFASSDDASSSVSSISSSTTSSSTTEATRDDSAFGNNSEQPFDRVFDPNVTNPNNSLMYEEAIKKAEEEDRKRDQIAARDSTPVELTGDSGKPNKTVQVDDFLSLDGEKEKSTGDNSRKGKSNNDDSKSSDQSDASPAVTQSSSNSTATKINDALKPNSSKPHHTQDTDRTGKHLPGHHQPSSALAVESFCSLVISLAILSFAQFQFISRRC